MLTRLLSHEFQVLIDVMGLVLPISSLLNHTKTEFNCCKEGNPCMKTQVTSFLLIQLIFFILVFTYTLKLYFFMTRDEGSHVRMMKISHK